MMHTFENKIASKNCQLEKLVTEKELIQRCKQKDRTAQKLLYDRYTPKMFGVCKRYVRNREDAEDILVNGFFKVLTNINQYTGKGNFEGWIRRVIVNEALMFLRKKHNFQISLEVSNVEPKASTITVDDRLAEQDILNLLNHLPVGYRTVFNLYVIEGYKHREIAEILEISINTSKSQLILAKKRMKGLLQKNEYPQR